MSSSARIIVSVACLAILAAPFAYSRPGRNNLKEREEDLNAKIEHENNPGKKARLQIHLAKLKLKEANAAYDQRHFEGGKVLLHEYLEQVKKSWATLQGADDAARKHVRALMDLEISLRENDRLLEDMRRNVPYPESEDIRQVETESSGVHTQVLEALFPSGFSRKPETKHSTSPKSSVATKLGVVRS